MYGGWKSPFFMSRKQSRITLEITDVRVQRVQDISTEDAEAEGCTAPPGSHVAEGHPRHPREQYARLWDTINGKKHPWSSNPWALSFKRVGA